MTVLEKTGVFKALADEARVIIVCAVAKRPGCTAGCDIVSTCEGLMNMSQPALSHHFAKLVSAGVLRVQKDGTKKSYYLNSERLHQTGIDINQLVTEQ